MSDTLVLLRLRRFLLGVAALIFAATVVELWLTGHFEGVIQMIPFALCGLGFVVVLAAVFSPRRAAIRILRFSMGFLAAGSLFGIYQHVSNNIAFQREIYPNTPAGELLWAAVAGANPLLAPGILALAAMLALAATYHHPSMIKDDAARRSQAKTNPMLAKR